MKKYLLILATVFILTGCSRELIITQINPYADIIGYQFIATANLTEDLRFPASDLTKAGNHDPTDGSFRGGTRALFYSGTSLNEQFIEAQLPHGRRTNSPLLLHWHFSPLTNNSGNVEWCAEFVCADIGSKFNSTITKCVNTTVGQGYYHYMSSGIMYTNTLDFSAMCTIRIYRDGAEDTYNQDVALLEFDIHYINERFGRTM